MTKEEKLEEQQAAEQEAEKAAEQQAEETTADADKDDKNEASEKSEADANLDRLIRLQADFENYKKRTQKEKLDIYQSATEDFIKKLLPVIDNLERAEAAAGEETADAYRSGVQMVFKQLMTVLEEEGLKEIEAEGTAFDPNYHHGVAVGAEDDKDDQTILEVFQKGYTFKEKVIRPAMVKVNQL